MSSEKVGATVLNETKYPQMHQVKFAAGKAFENFQYYHFNF